MTAPEVPSSRLSLRLAQIVRGALLLIVAVTPVMVDGRGHDRFRLTKTIFFEEWILLAGALAAAAALWSDSFAATLARNRRAVILACAGVVWVAIASMASTLPAVSYTAPFAIFCHALLFVLAIALLRSGSTLPALGAMFLPAVLNSITILLQAFDLWQPFGVEVEGADRFGNVGFIGNPNTAGTYLLIPTLAAITATLVFRRYRVVAGLITLVLLAGLFETQTITVMFGFTAALGAFVLTGSRRIRFIAVSLVIIAALGMLAYGPTRERLVSLQGPLRRGDFSTLTSNRVPAAVTTFTMFRDRPLLGLGPHVFAARYMPYRLAVDERNPKFIQLGRDNFGEAHNDHLQVLAETGIPGYVLLLLFAGSIAVLTFRRSTADDDRARFVNVFAFPAVAAFLAVALGQFPIELTAASVTYTYAAALCFAWRPDADR